MKISRAAMAITMLGAWVLASVLPGCGHPPAPADAGPDTNWTCPDGWVRNDPHGCGPAVWLCQENGGALAGACNGIAIDHPVPVATGDGGAGSTFFVRSDGTIGGAWPSDDSDAGPPAADWSPDAGIASCPTDHGWMQNADDGTCDVAIRTNCPAGTAPLPDNGRCTQTGASDCPSGAFADVSSETANAVYVAAGADPAMADGTAAHPDPTITAGIARAGANGWVVVGAGTYAESVVASASVHIVGLCAARTIVQPAVDALAIDANAAGSHVDVRGLTLRGGAGMIVRAGVTAAIARVFVDGPTNRGILVQGPGTTATIDGSAFNAVLERARDQGIAVLATNGASVTVQDTSVLDTHGNAFTAEGGSQLAVLGAYVRGVDSSAAGGALRARTHGRIVAERVVMERNAGACVYAFETGAHVSITDAIIRNTYGLGMQAFSGGSIDAERVLVERTSGGIGVQALSLDGQAPSIVTLRSSHVRDTTADSTGQYGSGVSALNLGIVDGSPVPEVHLDHVIVERSHSFGIEVQASLGEVSNSIVRRTLRSGMGYGWGITADYDATVSVTRSRIEGSAQISVMATAGGGTDITIADSVVSHAANPGTASAPGMVSLCHARLDALRVRVVGGVFAGVNSSDECPLIPDADTLTPGRAQLGLHDCVIEGTRTSPTPDVQGNAIIAVGGSGLVMERTLVRDSAEIGVIIGEPNTTATITDSAILDTHPSETKFLGDGLIVYQNANVRTERLYIHGAAEFGILSLLGASLDLHDTLVDAVAPNSRGYGAGVVAAGGATMTVDRVAIDDVAGAGIASVDGAIGFPSAPSTVTVHDALVRHVAASVLVEGAPSTSYGIHAAGGSSLACQHTVVDDSDYGFYVVDSSLRLDAGAIVRSRVAYGANSGSMPMLVDVFSAQNATDMIVSGVTLPPASGLPPPALPQGCTPAGCM